MRLNRAAKPCLLGDYRLPLTRELLKLEALGCVPSTQSAMPEVGYWAAKLLLESFLQSVFCVLPFCELGEGKGGGIIYF